MEPAIAVTARCEIRSVIRFLNAKKLTPIEIHRQLEEVYGKACISVQHVRKWCREFSEGRTDVHDEQRSGRPSVSDEVVAKRYCETLTKLKRAIQNRRRGRLSKGVRLHHDNARPHVSRQTTALLDKFGWKLLDHAPYSPDLAPSDFHLFPKLKQHLGGQRFSTDEEVKEAVTKYIGGLAAEFFEAGFQKWITRQKKCVERSGDYVEK